MNTNANKGCVLCIDDEPHVLRALQWLLRKDFEVHTCESAADALRLLRKHDFDVVVSDQRMPGITGVEFLRHVRKLAPRAMRILLTGYSDLDAMMDSVNESEVYRFITKPWDVRGLPQLIAAAAQVAREDQAATGPAASTAAPLAGALALPAAPAQMSESVLVIDDSEELHAMVEQELHGTAKVLHAFDLPAALDTLDHSPVSVIVSEVQVGGVDVTRLLRMIRHKHPQVVTLVLSGHRDAEMVMALINHGQVFRIVPKPVKPAFIRLIVEAALKRHRELVASPSAQRRYGVEENPPELAESLLADMVKAATRKALHAPPPSVAPALMAMQAGYIGIAAAPAPLLRDEGLVASLKAGFRRLFGA